MIFFLSCFTFFSANIEYKQDVFTLKKANILTYSKLKEDLPQCFIHNKVDGFNLNQYIDIYEDPGGVYTKDNIQSVDSLFKKNTGAKLSSDKIWLRLRLENQFTETVNWLIYFGPWEKITAYKVGNNEFTELGKTGVKMPLKERQTKIRTLPYIKLNIDNDTMKTFYFYLEKSDKLHWYLNRVNYIYAKLFSEKPVLMDEANNRLYLGFCLGIASFIILFNVILYGYTRETAYILNASYLFFWNLLFFSLYGFVFFYVMGSMPFWNIESNYVSMLPMLLFYSLLTKKYTRLKEYYPKWNMIFNSYIILALLMPVVRILEVWNLLEAMGFILFFLIFTSSVWVGFKAYFRGLPDLKFFLMGQVLFPLVLIYFFIDYGTRMTPNIEAVDLIELAVMVQSLCFSIGIASGLKRMERELFMKKQLENEMNFQAKNLNELNENKSRFFANISHELRTPLTLILGPLKQVLPKNHDPECRLHIKTAINNSERLLVLINQILDVAKLQKKSIELKLAPFNLVDLIRKSIESFRLLADEKSIKIETEGLHEAFVVNIDHDIMQKVIYNLLSNAIKFTSKNGKIIVSLKIESQSHFKIIVEDNGIGISDENINKIFERFFQVDNSGSREYEGSGIGLALCKELLELCNARISVYSNLRKGSRFIVDHPIMEKKNTDLMEKDFLSFISENKSILDGHFSARVESREQAVVLIVEDNKDMLTFISKLLEKKYKVLNAGNGKEAISIAMNTIPDIIICDIMMPKMDGYEFTQKIKYDIRTNHIPIILLTGKVSKNSRFKGLLTGADLYMEKPFEAEELELNISNILKSRALLLEKYKSPGFALLNDSSPENQYLEKIVSVIEKHIANADVSVVDLASELGMSQSNLYRKIKSTSGYSPKQFIRVIRLEYARKLIENSDYNITEIANRLGFISISYFTKMFKEKYGMSPLNYKSSKLEKTMVKK